MGICTNCKKVCEGNFCSNCGTPLQIKRIDKKFLIHEFQHSVLHLESGLLFTIKALSLNPGNAIRNYIKGERLKYNKPITFLIITSLLFAIFSHYFAFHSPEKADKYQFFLNSWASEHMSYANLITIVFTAFGLKYIFYRNQVYNYFEYVVLLSYITGMIMILMAIASVFSGIFHSKFILPYAQLPASIYCVWVIGQFFYAKNFLNYLKAFVASISGIIILSLLLSSIINILIAIGF